MGYTLTQDGRKELFKFLKDREHDIATDFEDFGRLKEFFRSQFSRKPKQKF